MSRCDFLFVMNNPGSLKAALPVAEALPNSILFYTPTIQSLVPSHNQFKPLPQSAPEDCLTAVNPKVLITGNSVPHGPGGNLEHEFRRAAHKLQIPTVTILDHWCNYRERFFFKDENGHEVSSLPNWICVMDERAKQEMICEGFSENILVVTGQPAFDVILREKNHLPTLRIQIRKKLNIPNDQQMIGFISEPVLEDHGKKRGYSQLDVLEDLKKALLPAQKLIVRLHPRDDKSKYDPTLLYSYSDSALEFIAACDAIVGMTSILLFEAHLLGVPILSYQPGAQKRDPNVTTIFPLPWASQVSDLVSFLKKRPILFPSFYMEANASQKVSVFLKKLAQLRSLDSLSPAR